jgi:precorrin-2 dehydrogenase/sirohydrochlorin ferrochelatase
MMVDLAGRRAVVVGGGAVAERKVRRLLECRADVTVVSPTATAPLRRLAAAGRLDLVRREVRTSDLRGAFLVLAATDRAEVNRRVAQAATRRGALVNVADDPAACTFQAPAVARRGDLTIAISTGGGSPALAKRIRERLETVIGPEYEAFLDALRALRERIRRAVPDSAARQALLRRAVASPLYEEAARGDRRAVQARIDALVAEAQAPRTVRSRLP